MAKPLEERIQALNDKLQKIKAKQDKLLLKEGPIRTKLQYLQNQLDSQKPKEKVQS